MARPSSSAWPSQKYQVDMYDDCEDEPSSSSRSYFNSGKDHEKTPPRGHTDTDSGRRWEGSREVDNDRQYHQPRSRSTDRRRRHDPHHVEEYRSSRCRSRSHSRSPPYYGASPNRTVIFDGTMELSQEDILNELQNRLRIDGIEEVRLIRDKRTGQSRQFAFAQFAGTPQATKFLDHYYPTIVLYPPRDPSDPARIEPVNVRIAYSREKEDRDRVGKGDDEWKCDVCHVSNFSHRNLCFRCNAPRTRSTANGIMVTQANISVHSGFATTGDSDTSTDGAASQYVLIRGLEPGASEELLAKGVGKLYKIRPETDAAESRVAKKAKIASTSNDSSLGAKEGSLRRVLLVRDRRTGESWRYGFAEFNTVEDAQAAMAKFNSLEKLTISSKPVIASFIHAGVFVPVLHPVDELTRFTFCALNNPALRLMYWDESAYVSEHLVEVQEKPRLPRPKENEHARIAAAAAADEGIIGAGKDGQLKQKKRKVEKDSKVVAPHLQFWTNQHAELRGKTVKEDSDANALTSMEETPHQSEALSSQSFADLQRKCCLLCSRQFRTGAEVNKHERMSQLHRDNLTNTELVTKALAKMSQLADASLDNSAYRDRARERRQVYNQPKQPAAQHYRPAIDEAKKEEQLTKSIQSKGAALLGKMGWTAGEGLGAQGLGRTEAIQTHLYTQGVGLGAEGGKIGDAMEEADRQTKGSYSDFLNKGKEKAKARFESLG